MHDIAFIGGAKMLSRSGWPLQQLDDPTFFHIEYPRVGLSRNGQSPSKSVLAQQADGILPSLLKLDRPVDLIGHSKGAILAILAAAEADKVAPGLVRNVILVTPGVFHGPPPYDFHRSWVYVWNLAVPKRESVRKMQEALVTIESAIPDFRYDVSEHPHAMMEAGDGVVHIPEGFDKTRIRMYYVYSDSIIPRDVSRYVAERAKIKVEGLETEYGHLLPLLDTEGTFLEMIRSENA